LRDIKLLRLANTARDDFGVALNVT